MPDTSQYAVVHKGDPTRPVTLPNEPLVGSFHVVRATFLHETGWSDTEMARRGFSLVRLDSLGPVPAPHCTQPG